jgi:hypothetical protein
MTITHVSSGLWLLLVHDNVYEDNELFQDDTAEDNAEKDMEYYRVNRTGRWRRSLSSGGPPRPENSGMSAAKAQEAIKVWTLNIDATRV